MARPYGLSSLHAPYRKLSGANYGPYPRISDTVGDYASGGSVVARRVSLVDGEPHQECRRLVL